MAADNIVDLRAPDGAVYTLTVTGTQVAIRDNHFRTTPWNAFSLPAAGTPITGTCHPCGILEVDYPDANGNLVRRFSVDDGVTWQ